MAVEISAAEFKAKCLKLMDEIAKTRKSITITKRGRPVARLVPAESEARKPLFGYMSGTISRIHDIECIPPAEWEADAGTEPNLFPTKRRRPRK
jgi:prevent-host-death family protein